MCVRASVVGVAVLAACGSDPDAPAPVDPDTAERVVVDRFSGELGVMLARATLPGLPGPDEPIDFDRAPFLFHGLGPGGERTTHYHLDGQRAQPVNIYVLHYPGEVTPVPDQLPLVEYVPGDHGYTDFWRLVLVEVPDDYVANTVTSTGEMNQHGWPTMVTEKVINCPVVPAGSTARLRRGVGAADTELHRGWYKGKVFSYFTFEEEPLTVTGGGAPRGTMYAAYNVNPPASGGGWASGLMVEAGGDQSHAVVSALDGAAYAPLWSLQIYDNTAFAAVLS